jgi:uncharacterized membrane protein
MNHAVGFLKTTIVGGIVFLVPVIVVLVIFGKAIEMMIRLSQPFVRWLPFSIPGEFIIVNLLAVLLILLLCFMAGFLAETRGARRLVRALEARFLDRIPIYSLVKGVTSSLAADGEDKQLAPVYVQFDDCAQVGLEVERLADGSAVVFIPAAPNAWSGSVLVVAANRVTNIDATMLTAVQNIRHLGRETDALLQQRKPVTKV